MITKTILPFITMYKSQSDINHNPHGPAIIYSDEIAYYLNGRKHNIVGPARLKSNNNRYYIKEILIGGTNNGEAIQI